jgi:predicted TPR repeat methyltransferase
MYAQFGMSLDDLFDDIEESLKEMHADEEDYKPPENLKEVVATMQKTEQTKMLEYKRQMAEALEYEKKKKMQ